MNNQHDLNTYSKLADGANFFLAESFKYIDIALEYELSEILFSKKLESVNPTEKDLSLFEKVRISDDNISVLQSKEENVISDETKKIIKDLWSKSQFEAENKSFKFGLNHNINSIEILGHLNNLGFFIETLVNRHLLFLNQIKKIDNLSYKRFIRAKVMERLIYIFKEDLSSNKVQLNEIVNLFSLRNKTVHFTPDNAKDLKPKISELIQIWNQCIKIISILEKTEKFNEENFSEILKQNINYIKNRWV